VFRARGKVIYYSFDLPPKAEKLLDKGDEGINLCKLLTVRKILAGIHDTSCQVAETFQKDKYELGNS
jgi:hypothetical protein